MYVNQILCVDQTIYNAIKLIKLFVKMTTALKKELYSDKYYEQFNIVLNEYF